MTTRPLRALAATLLCLALGGLVSGCFANSQHWDPNMGGPPPPEPKKEPPEIQVAALLDAFHDAAARADEPSYFACFAEGGVFLGTDATERWDAPSFRAWAHPFFAKGKAWTFKSTRRAVAIAQGKDVAWFDEDLASETLGALRGSGVMVREKEGFRIAQYVLSVTIPNPKMKDVHALLAPPAVAPSAFAPAATPAPAAPAPAPAATPKQ